LHLAPRPPTTRRSQGERRVTKRPNSRNSIEIPRRG
jgi:hypothetical protein